MKGKDNNYLVYKAKNDKNGKIYIGVTTYNVNQRKLDHIERAPRKESNKFHEAISTYGADVFKWEQIDSANSLDELALKEKQYILEFDSKENGYNSDSGGGFKKTVYQYNLEDGSLVNKHNSLSEAGKARNTTKQHISRACLSVNNTYGGCYWSYENKVPF